VPGEALGVDGGGGDDDLEIRPLGEQLGQISEQEVDVEDRSWASSMMIVS
jgi:hypothetical protein